MLTVTIDGKKVNVPKGTMLITAAFQAGADVPYFCHHPRLTPAGACRMCLVRIEKMAKLQTACTVPVADGMVVDTLSPEVKQAQQGILEFLLINHPLDCPICDRGGECPLQNMTFQYGPAVTRFIDEKRHFAKPVALSEYVSIDRERCIQCARCTRFQAEIAGDGALSIQGRGNSAVISPFSLEGLNSKFSGNTVELCPVGALLSRPYRFQSRPWEFHSTDSICSMCGVGCNIAVQTRTDRLMRVNARENDAVNEEWTCDSGKFEQYWVNSEDRITTPHIRRAGIMKPASWDEALDAVVGALTDAVKSGPNFVAGIGSTRTSNEENYLFQRLFKDALGSNNVDHRMLDFPMIPMETSIADIGRAKHIVAVGFEPKDYLPVIWLWIYKAISKGKAVYTRVDTAADPAVASAIAAGEGSIILTDDKIGHSELDKLTAAATATGAKINVLLPDNNSWGAIKMGVLPEQQGLATWDILKAASAGQIRALYIMGSNPAVSFPDRDLAAAALDKAPFVVVQDLFMTETALLADVFLPSSSFIEKDGTFTNIEGRVQHFKSAIKPIGNSRPDWQILGEILAQLGKAAPFFGPSDITRELIAAGKLAAPV